MLLQKNHTVTHDFQSEREEGAVFILDLLRYPMTKREDQAFDRLCSDVCSR